jgi:hypothetical protein
VRCNYWSIMINSYELFIFCLSLCKLLVDCRLWSCGFGRLICPISGAEFIKPNFWFIISWDSSVIKVTGFGFDDWGSVSSRGRNSSPFHHTQIGSGADPASYLVGYQGCLPRSKPLFTPIQYQGQECVDLNPHTSLRHSA